MVYNESAYTCPSLPWSDQKLRSCLRRSADKCGTHLGHFIHETMPEAQNMPQLRGLMIQLQPCIEAGFYRGYADASMQNAG